jgi:hypothetical protein
VDVLDRRDRERKLVCRADRGVELVGVPPEEPVQEDASRGEEWPRAVGEALERPAEESASRRRPDGHLGRGVEQAIECRERRVRERDQRDLVGVL